MPSRMSSSISALLLATTAGLMLPASAQTAPSPLFQSFANGGLKVGCPWLMSNDADTNNTGLVDVAATYRFSTIPVNPGNGGKIRLTGKFPKARYFSFQTYDGFRPGNDIDQLSDALIMSDGGSALDPNPAFLTARTDLDTYTVDIVFEDRPAPPLVRAPNTLYAGSGTTHGAFNKQLVYRIYLPDPGADELGDRTEPTQTFVGPQGEIDLKNTPDKSRCNTIATVQKYNVIFPVTAVGQPQSKLAFHVVSGRGGLNFYPNGDGNFLRGLIAKQYGDLVVIRGKVASTPALFPDVVANPDTRYFSLCEFQPLNSSTVACLADRDTVTIGGYYTAVISTPVKRPVLANAESGYNWLPFGNGANGLIGLRQILPNPAFAGNYNLALANPDAPLEETLGEWAPSITYCDSNTFAAHAAAGGQAVFDACKLAADARKVLGN